MQVQIVSTQKHRRISRKFLMNDQERKAETQLPPAPETPSEAAAAILSTLPPPNGAPPEEMAPESDPTLRAAGEHYASPAVERMSIERLLDMNGRVESYMRELLDPKGSFAQNRVQTVTDLSLVVENGFKRIAAAFEPRFTGIEAKLSKQGDNILALEMRIKDMEGHIADLRREVEQLKEQRAQGAAAAPA